MGDVIYAHFDAYGIELKLNDHRTSVAVYLEPNVIHALTRVSQTVFTTWE